jgi:transmembrane sensor
MTEQYQAAIQKVWKEALSTEEKLLLLEELSKDEAGWKASLQQLYEQDIHNGHQYLPVQRSEQVLQQLHERIRLMDEAATGLEPASKLAQLRPRILRRVAGIAAAILLIAGFFWYPSKKTTTENDTLALHKPVREYKRLVNQTDKQQIFRLDDGSEVKLAPGSAIVWLKDFSRSERKIQLAGQAWFDVAKDNRRPFSVHVAGITTTALGTKFMVNAIHHSKVAVQLFEGKVKIESATGKQAMEIVFLEPGQQCLIDAQLQAVVSSLATSTPSTGKPAPVLTAKNQLPVQRIKSLEFVQTPLVDVLTQLGNRYHVHFTYEAAALSKDQVTGTFLASDSLSVALKLLRSINNLSFSQYQDTILVSKLK